ncbi:MAG: hypothetical protein HRT82_10685 [Henriciella sp.]|nr:hypothetical protein [Henriciella sp.]
MSDREWTFKLEVMFLRYAILINALAAAATPTLIGLFTDQSALNDRHFLLISVLGYIAGGTLGLWGLAYFRKSVGNHHRFWAEQAFEVLGKEHPVPMEADAFEIALNARKVGVRLVYLSYAGFLFSTLMLLLWAMVQS